MAHGMRKGKDLKRFVYYSIYAWGFPCLLTIFTFMMDSYNIIDKKYKPNIGKTSCWFGKFIHFIKNFLELSIFFKKNSIYTFLENEFSIFHKTKF